MITVKDINNNGLVVSYDGVDYGVQNSKKNVIQNEEEYVADQDKPVHEQTGVEPIYKIVENNLLDKYFPNAQNESEEKRIEMAKKYLKEIQNITIS